MLITPIQTRQRIKLHQATPSSPRQSAPPKFQASPGIKFGMQDENSHTGAARRQALQDEIQEQEESFQLSTIPPSSLNLALAYPDGASDDEPFLDDVPSLLVLLPSAQSIHPNQVTTTCTSVAPALEQNDAAQNQEQPQSPAHMGNIRNIIGGFALTALGVPLAVYGYPRGIQNPWYGVLGVFGQIIGVIGAVIGGLSGVRELRRMYQQSWGSQQNQADNV